MKKSLIAVLSMIMIALSAGPANALVIINVTESGGNVNFNTSGSLDLSGATYLGGIGYMDGFISGGSNWYVASGAGGAVDNYAFTAFDGAFGTNFSFFSNPTSIFGDDFFIWGQAGQIEQVGVNVGYQSGAAISSGMTFSGTIAGFGMLAGVYNYALPNDLVQLRISQPTAVPEPGTIGLFSLGLLGLVIARRRRA